MEVQLQELVEKIRKDGVEAAEARAAGIVSDAESRAAEIVRAAKAEAEAIVRDAKAESARFETAAEASLAQAARNLLLTFRDGVSAELRAIVSRDTSSSYDADVLRTLIPETVKKWIASTGEDSLAVLLPVQELSKLESSLKSALTAELSKGLVIKADRGLGAGFRIASGDGAAYYDFSAEAVADLFSAYVSPRVAEIMKSASKGL